MRERTQLHENNAVLLRMAVELAPTGILALDQQGTILLANREAQRLFGYSRSELVGASVEMLVPDRVAAHHAGYREQYFRDPTARRMGVGRELHARRKDGTEVEVEVGLSPIATPNGMMALASVVDISARRMVEGHVTQTQKLEAIGTLAGGIAHDFNNILLGIIGYTELAMRDESASDDLKVDLRHVLNAAERGRKLVQRILAFSAQREVAHHRVALPATVGEAWALLRATLPTTIEMRDSFHATTPEVFSDETQVQQILMNLATNAAHAMPEGGTLEARLTPVRVEDDQADSYPGLEPGLYARLSVIDDGVGMSDEVKRRVFEPFYTTRPQGQGTGLGLSVVHGIVRAHGGMIDIASQPGRGTRIDVYLPAAPARAPAEPEPPDNDDDAPHVLVVEDEETIAQMYARQLRAMGYRVTACTSADDALQRFSQAPARFALVITDNTMPGMTGLSLTGEMTRIRSDLPVLLVSGLAGRIPTPAIREAGIRAVLPKPHTRDELAVAVETLVGRPKRNGR